MRRTFLLLFSTFLAFNLTAQSIGSAAILAGSYSTTINQDRVTLIIEHKAGSSYTATMNDGYQASPLVLELSGYAFEGVLIEPTQGVELQVYGEIKGDQLVFNFIVDPYGDGEDMQIILARDEPMEVTSQDIQTQPSGKMVFPVGAVHPQEVIGTWTKEELYNSGSGDNYMGAGFTETMTFLPDGQVSEGGSIARVSGSNFSGHSSGQGNGVIPGVGWYTIDNRLYIQVTDQGQTQNMQLGTYYVEGNNMLITGTSGEKMLLSRKN